MIKKIFDLIDSIELLFLIVFATAVLMAVFVGTFLGILASGNISALAGFTVLVIATIAGLVRDFIKKKLSAISCSIGLMWLVCAAYVVWNI